MITHPMTSLFGAQASLAGSVVDSTSPFTDGGSLSAEWGGLGGSGLQHLPFRLVSVSRQPSNTSSSRLVSLEVALQWVLRGAGR